MNRKTDKEEHRKYYHNGIEVPSCTTIIGMLNKPELVGWANHMGFKQIDTRDFVQERARYGTYCHKVFEVYFSSGILSAECNGDEVTREQHRDIVYHARVVELWFEKLHIRPIRVELPLEGSTYGGTLDMLCYNEEKDCLMIFDIKTSKAIRQTHWIQLMGYVQLLKEVYDLPVEEVGIILLSKPINSPELITIKTTKECWREASIFNKLKDVYYILNSPDEIVKEVVSGLVTDL